MVKYIVKFIIVRLGRLGRTHTENIAFKISNTEILAICSIVES